MLPTLPFTRSLRYLFTIPYASFGMLGQEPVEPQQTHARSRVATFGLQDRPVTCVATLSGNDERSDQNVHVQEPSHGKSAKSSLTCPDESGNARGLAFKTGSPVSRSIPNTGLGGRGRIGSKTIRSASRAISKHAPGRSPSFRRTVAGSTTWPLLESVVLISNNILRSFRPPGTPCG